MYKKYFDRLLAQLALDYNCNAEDLLKDSNTIVASALNEGRRLYSTKKTFLSMVTVGRGIVISADGCMHEFLREFAKGKPGHRLMEHKNLAVIDRELMKYGYGLTQTHHMFLPCRDVTQQADYAVKWYYDEEIHQFYSDGRFENAICEEALSTRPDRIAVVAYDGDTIMGMAGCSEDAPHWMQIGIDVMPEYRSKGVGTYLVTLLKNRITEMGDIPFYGTGAGNLHSQNIALNCGFKPAWVDIESKPVRGRTVL